MATNCTLTRSIYWTVMIVLEKNVKPEGFIYLWDNQSLLLLRPFEAAMHRNYAMELHIGHEAPFMMDFGEGWKEHRAVLIESNQAHRFRAEHGWQAIYMMDPAGWVAGCRALGKDA